MSFCFQFTGRTYADANVRLEKSQLLAHRLHEGADGELCAGIEGQDGWWVHVMPGNAKTIRQHRSPLYVDRPGVGLRIVPTNNNFVVFFQLVNSEAVKIIVLFGKVPLMVTAWDKIVKLFESSIRTVRMYSLDCLCKFCLCNGCESPRSIVVIILAGADSFFKRIRSWRRTVQLHCSLTWYSVLIYVCK